MASTTLKPTAITRETTRLLHTYGKFINNVDKTHDKTTTYGGQKRGNTIGIRLPDQYTIRTGWTLSVQDTLQEKIDLVRATVRGVDLYFTDDELAQDIDGFSKEHMKSPLMRLASAIDSWGYQTCYKQVYNSVGTPGTTPSAALTYLQAHQKLNDYLTPEDDRITLISSAAQAASVNAHLSLFNPSSTIAKQFRKGQIAGNVLGSEQWYMSQNVPRHTTGSRAGTTLVNGTISTEGSTSLAIDGLSGATQTVKEGDVLTVAGVYAVNPETKETYDFLQQFVVRADATAATSAVTLTVSPAMRVSGARQTISAFPVDNAAVTFMGAASTSYPQNLTYFPEAFTFASADLELPGGVDFAGREAPDGVSVRVVRDWDHTNSQMICRIDILCGIVAQVPSMACRIWG